MLAPLWTNKNLENQQLINLICWTLLDHPNHCAKFRLDWSSQLHRLPKFIKNKTFWLVNPVTKFYLFLRMLSHLMIYHDIVRSGDCYKICLGGSLSRNKGCKSFFLCGDNNQWLLCCHDGKACKKNIDRYILCINVCTYILVF